MGLGLATCHDCRMDWTAATEKMHLWAWMGGAFRLMAPWSLHRLAVTQTLHLFSARSGDTCDVLSHLSVRARNMHVLFATCFDPKQVGGGQGGVVGMDAWQGS